MTAAGGRRPDTAGSDSGETRDQASIVDRWLALAVVAVIAMRVDLFLDIPLGTVVAAAVAPLWIMVAWRFRPFRWLAALGFIAAVGGVLLTHLNPADGVVSGRDMVTRTSVVLGVVIATGALIWCAEIVSTSAMAFAFGTGMLLGIPFNSSGLDNAWRFTYSIPVAIFVLAVVGRLGKLWLQLAVLAVLAAVGLLNDSRSNSSMLLLVGVLLLAQVLARRSSRRARMVGAVVLGVAGSLTVYSVVTSAILEGAFGEATQQRTQEQIDRAGSVLLGGRPEISASAALIQEHPWGIGSGIGLTYNDIMVAKEAMWAIGYDPNNGYVERFMFGGSAEVHSVLGDFWLWFGLPGAIFILFILGSVLRGVVSDFAMRALTPLFAFVAIRLLWDMPFSPAASAARLLPLTIAFAFIGYRARRQVLDGDPDPGATADSAGPRKTSSGGR